MEKNPIGTFKIKKSAERSAAFRVFPKARGLIGFDGATHGRCHRSTRTHASTGTHSHAEQESIDRQIDRSIDNSKKE